MEHRCILFCPDNNGKYRFFDSVEITDMLTDEEKQVILSGKPFTLKKRNKPSIISDEEQK